MSARPHVHTVFKAEGITVDMRVFWKNDTDKQLVLNEAFYQYCELVSKIQEKMDESETTD